MRYMDYIHEIFKDFRKDDLLDIGAIFGLENMRSSNRKQDILDHLSSHIQQQPEVWLDCMMERDLRFVRDILSFPEDEAIWLEYAEYPTIFEAIGLIHWSEEDEHFRKIWIDKEFREIVSPYIDAAIEEGEKSGRFEIESVMLGILNIYGVIHLEDFLQVLYSFYEEPGRNTDIVKVSQVATRSTLLKVYREMDYFFSPCVERPQDIRIERKRFRKNQTYKKITYRQALEAGTDAPFFVLKADSAQCQSLVETLRKIGYDDIVIRRKLHDIWMDSQFVDDDGEAESCFSVISDKQDDFESFEEYKSAMQRVVDYVNVLPKWKLCGRSSEESGILKLVLKTDESVGKALPQMALMNLFVPHVAPDDPCPCGSGLSYRNCHGKFIS